MRSSSILTLLGATLAISSPVLNKKAIVYDVVTDIVWVTVTKGAEAASSAQPATTVAASSTIVVAAPLVSSTALSHSKIKPTSSYVPPPPSTSSTTPPPPPSTTSIPPPPPTTATEAAPVETTQASVEIVSTTSVAPASTAAAAAPHANAASSSDSSTNPLAGTGVSNHNTCRSAHSAANVAWNNTLAAYAAKTAATCVFAHDMNEGGGGYGQNIASQGSSSATAWTLESALENAIISEWYSEASIFAKDNLYGEESPAQNGDDWLHFTQIVWKNSLEIGCAVQQCPTSNSIFPGLNAWFTVCNYYPQGNVEGEFADNVSPN